MTTEARAEDPADAAVRAARPGMLSASTVAAVMGVSVDALVRWLDAGDDLAPPAVRQPKHRYRFRAAVIAPWLREHGYHVPPALSERAKAEM